MNAMMLPLVSKIAGPEEYPYSRTKIHVGQQHYIIVDRHGPLLTPVLVRYNFTNDPMQEMQMVGYHCKQCKTTFMAYEIHGYIHKCCEVE